jgi:hypothetical protein
LTFASLFLLVCTVLQPVHLLLWTLKWLWINTAIFSAKLWIYLFLSFFCELARRVEKCTCLCCVKFEVIRAVTMDIVCWDMIPHYLIDDYQCFGGFYPVTCYFQHW